MPAHPFGGHPTLFDYCQWALRNGCRVTSAMAQNDNGMPVSVTIIETSDGKSAAEAGVQKDERLAPTTVARLDRQLGLKSPFASLPDR